MKNNVFRFVEEDDSNHAFQLRPSEPPTEALICLKKITGLSNRWRIRIRKRISSQNSCRSCHLRTTVPFVLFGDPWMTRSRQNVICLHNFKSWAGLLFYAGNNNLFNDELILYTFSLLLTYFLNLSVWRHIWLLAILYNNQHTLLL